MCLSASLPVKLNTSCLYAHMGTTGDTFSSTSQDTLNTTNFSPLNGRKSIFHSYGSRSLNSTVFFFTKFTEHHLCHCGFILDLCICIVVVVFHVAHFMTWNKDGEEEKWGVTKYLIYVFVRIRLNSALILMYSIGQWERLSDSVDSR